MKLKFKKQQYQTEAVEALVECFEGQPHSNSFGYTIDAGYDAKNPLLATQKLQGFANETYKITPTQIFENIRAVQARQGLPLSKTLAFDKVTNCGINLDIEMETGTGKTYCYIKTMFELNRKYGWSKFIVVVPSIAIREGVYKTFEITSDHFFEDYGKRARFFIYNSSQLHNLESFSSDSGINVMIINVQAFNATGKDNRRIYEELDDFQSRKPIDVIKANNPILILDEPQRLGGRATLESLANFNALMMLRYSATHKVEYNKIHRLDALDAYNKKLVKKIAVKGISVRGLTGTNAYLYVSDILISRDKPPVAVVEFEQKLQSGIIKRIVRKLAVGDNLFDLSNGLDQYKGFVVNEIDARDNTISFVQKEPIAVGETTEGASEEMIRRIQIREAIRAHLEKERQLFTKGVKVLTLFFIDSVAKYRQYEGDAEVSGEYAQIFEEEYESVRADLGMLHDPEYAEYLNRIPVAKTHNGYFSIDKKTKKLVDPKVAKRGEDAGQADDVDAYDLILKDKERLLSFDEPTRFIFSHSALREGWDNPNVFVICTLKHSDNTISRRQEVGRGMRIAVNQDGDRMDDPNEVHKINVLTVVTSESYTTFVNALQSDINESLVGRPRKADISYFTGKTVRNESGELKITPEYAAEIFVYLKQNGYVDKQHELTTAYKVARETNELSPLSEDLVEFSEPIFKLIDAVLTGKIEIENGFKGRMIEPNENFKKKEFQELWRRINKKAVYTVHFDSAELIENCIAELNSHLRVDSLLYKVESGVQLDQATIEQLRSLEAFKEPESRTESVGNIAHTAVKYDLIGKIVEETNLTRKTVATILTGIQPSVFDQFKKNPEHFISKASQLINEQKATMIVEHLTYDKIAEEYDTNIFTPERLGADFKGAPVHHHIYDFVPTDSKVEQEFATKLDNSEEVVVYAKLPRGFKIPTPVGDYNPDWAISFKEGIVKHVYFVAETKGTLTTMELRKIEKAKIDSARKFFGRIISSDVKYDVVDSYDALMQVIK